MIKLECLQVVKDSECSFAHKRVLPNRFTGTPVYICRNPNRYKHHSLFRYFFYPKHCIKA